MSNKLKIIPLIILIVIILVVYLYPVPQRSFKQLATNVDAKTESSLESFHAQYKAKILEVDGKDWEYITAGNRNNEALLFLHGMTGDAYIWWQQIKALATKFYIISITYAPVNSLGEMDAGVTTILANERVSLVNVVGTSLGGYYAQYFIAKHPENVQRLVLANTFAPNDLIKDKNGTLGSLLPVLPEWVIMDTLRGSIEDSIYPASGNNELVKAYLLEMTYGKMSKAQFIARYRCVIEKFSPPDLIKLSKYALIIESDNDPLVEPALRQQLKETYPTAKVIRFQNVGHFPYLVMPDEYTLVLLDFLALPIMY